MTSQTMDQNFISEIVLDIHDGNGVRFYCGNSMDGVFLLGDRLLVEPVPHSEIHPGDIIIFRKMYSNGVQGEVVHRVVSKKPLACFTRGDNNLFVDYPPVLWEQVVGKVHSFERDGRRISVVGGLPGLWASQTRWLILLVKRLGRMVFRRFYHVLRQSGFVPKVWRPTIKKISLETSEGFLVKYLYNQRTVAMWNRTTREFVCDKPFDLVILPPEEDF